LNGNYLGDGYPLCTDLPNKAFLAKGAKYEFVGYAFQGDVYAPPQSSGLYQALSKSTLIVNLEEDLACKGEECSFQRISVVRVRDAFYEYVAPTCVHLFIYNGQSVQSFERAWDTKCVGPDTPVAGFACCSGCTDNPTGFMRGKSMTCDNSETFLARHCNKNPFWRDHKFCQRTCWKINNKWEGKLAYDGDDCSAGAYKERLACDSSLKRVSLAIADRRCKRLGMSLCSKRPAATCSNSKSYLWTGNSCSLSVRVHEDGKVSGNTQHHQQSKFEVVWGANGAAPAGDYKAAVRVQKVFPRVPKKSDLLARLKIGAFRPTTSCTHSCNGVVKAYTTSGIFDDKTVFECEGRFYKNAESTVHVDTWTFRNPPVFVRPGIAGPDNSHSAIERAILDEVESLIDHLFYHPNTPVNIGKQLIKRFVTSNPSAGYVEAVGNAFRTGTYDGIQYSGKYGDLGATVAAILLHPEAMDATAATPKIATVGNSSIKSGDTVFLRTYAGSGAHIDVDGSGAVRARWEARGNWQAIVIEKLDGGSIHSGDTVFLKTHSGVFIDIAGTNVRARWNNKGAWQAVVIEKRSGNGAIHQNDLVCFNSQNTGRHLDVQNQKVRARWHHCGDWQTVLIEKEVPGAISSGDLIHLAAHTGKRIEVEGNIVKAR